MSTGRLGAGDTAIQPTILDAKGDLIVATAADTPARLAVGSNGQVLKADSSTATGLAWGADSSAAFSGVYIYNSGTISTANNTWTAVTCDTEGYDTDGFHSTSTNTDRITIPTGKGGYYYINASIPFHENATGIRVIQIYKNGNTTPVGSGEIAGTAVGYPSATISVVLNLSAGDYFSIRARQTSGGNLNIYPTLNGWGWIQAIYLGA